jgi:hypothetical protein
MICKPCEVCEGSGINCWSCEGLCCGTHYAGEKCEAPRRKWKIAYHRSELEQLLKEQKEEDLE